ncbi:MAG: DUF2783 domain-containing protein [Gammaproteobacteria bacterium]|nr:DUF2783 domain-containing protein [Gammaproteobacteria bacterium]
MSAPAGALSIFPGFPRRWPAPPAISEESGKLLKRENNFHQPGKRFFRPYRPGDDFYEALIETHRDLSEAQSAQVNARLILLLSNHIGDLNVLREALALARDGVLPEVDTG